MLADGGPIVYFTTLIACLATNVYIVGLNQLVDVDIDRINKPFLPLASGDLTLAQGRWIVAFCGLLAVVLAMTQGTMLVLVVVISMLIGSAYSLRPVHLKGRPFWAALSIAFVRGFVANIGLFLHFHQLLEPSAPIPWPLVIGITLFFFGFGLAIAVYKDIPDRAGDSYYGIRTFTVRLGPERVFKGGRLLLTLFYLIPIFASLSLLPSLDGILLFLTHLFIVVLFWSRSFSVDLADPAAVTRFYMFLWSLFYVEYLILSLNVIVSTQINGMI